MIAIRGFYYDGTTSAQVPAECRVYDNGAVQIQGLDGGEVLVRLSCFELRASPRLAHTRRNLYFPGGQKFETGDNRAVDEVMARFHKRSGLHAVHLLESRKRYILICLAAMLAILWVTGRYGVPAAARLIAHQLPQSMVQQAGRQTLDILDHSFFKPSRLDVSENERLSARFQPLIQAHAALNLQVRFREGGRLGANAFALPGGTIVFTDEMVKLAADDNELLSVLAHEAGHVALRHGIQRIIQDSLIAFAVMAITGDNTGAPQLFIGLPVALTELAYSREFEREADQYALAYLQANGISPRHFANLMRRLQNEKHPENAEMRGRWSNYLSTHPPTEERLQRFERFE
jgi:Zn-dependent protease with chaperone function